MSSDITSMADQIKMSREHALLGNYDASYARCTDFFS